MTFQDFQSILARKTFAPVLLFYGDEDFLIDECVKGIVESILDEGTKSFNLDVVYGSKTDVKEVLALASAFPLMSERRVVVVKEFEKLGIGDGTGERFTTYLQNPLASTCLVLIAQKTDFRKKPFTDLKKHADLVECKSLYDNQVPDWIAGRIAEMGKSVDPDASRILQAYVGNSLRALQNEIEKLFVFVGGKNVITAGDVTEVVGASKGFTIFELQNAIGKKDLKEALHILQAMLQAGQSPQMIIVMLTRFLNQLWRIGEIKRLRAPDAEMAKTIGVHPYFLRQIVQFQSNFSETQIEQGYRALLEADTVLKSTGRDPRLVMDLLVYTLVRGTPLYEEIVSNG
ncbi:MAG: DNA polymerase III subunit delta [Ignavibacteriales bacterium]|nr:DNA polymerase III subunit delta [Ignavibacteriales bacterium]